MYQKTVALKAINKNLKVLLAVGGNDNFSKSDVEFFFDNLIIFYKGWNQGSLQFSNMARSKTNRLNFVEKAISFLKKHRFDGLG